MTISKELAQFSTITKLEWVTLYLEWLESHRNIGTGQLIYLTGNKVLKVGGYVPLFLSSWICHASIHV